MSEFEQFTPDVLFPSDNDLEIPTLRLDVQPKMVEIPFVLYGEQKRTFDMCGQGTLHFYTDDYRFNTIFEQPKMVYHHHPHYIVEPNYSLFSETPFAFGIHQIYKKRFFSRLMQQHGIGVFVDLNVAPKYYKANLLGVPAGYSSFCTRGYSDRLVQLEFEYNMAKSIAGENELTFIIYGGGRECRQFAKENNCVYVTPLVSIKKRINRIEGLAKVSESVLFNDEKDIKELATSAIANIKTGQVENFYTEKDLLQ